MSVGPVTLLLREAAAGSRLAQEEVLALIYDELRKLAGRQLRHAPGNQQVQPTMLVHDAFLGLMERGQIDWESRGHFLAVAAKAMRELAIQQARREASLKRGGGARREPLDTGLPSEAEALDDVLALNEALCQLEEHDAESARIVELRFFAGLDRVAAAEVVGLSPATLDRRWAQAKDWLRQRLEAGPAN